MPGWTLVDIHPTGGRAFQRPLGALELPFFWASFLNGTSDSLHHYELCLSNGSQDADLFSDANIVRAWLSTKRRYPLAGATVRGADDAPLRLDMATDSNKDIGIEFASEPHFVVREHDLAVLRPCEIVFGCVASAEEAQRQAVAILHGPRQLSNELLARLYLFRETDPKRANVLHLMMLVAHGLTDGIATRTFMRCLLDTLARGGGDEPAQIALEERLAMTVYVEPVYLRSLSPAIRRWRRAVGMVIARSRMARIQGGHTLPCRLTHSTPHTSARPGHVLTSLTPTQTTAVIDNCRMHNLTFGSAYVALAQVAMTRVLYRRYLRGEISEEEWTYRKRQPHINMGPVNLRPYFDKTWFDKGGGGEFMTFITLAAYQLPFMTLGATAGRDQLVLSDGAPPFSELLTFDRFWHRARLVKRQTTAFFSHPLLLEIIDAAIVGFLQDMQLRALRWMQRVETAGERDTRANGDEDKVLAVADIPMVWAHGGSSLGNMNLISPAEYPLPPTHPLSVYSSVPHPVKAGYATLLPSSRPTSEVDVTPKIVVENAQTVLHMFPASLYLGAVTSRGQMDMLVHYDRNVFEEGVVREWLDEVRGAVLWYLGQTQCPAGSGDELANRCVR